MASGAVPTRRRSLSLLALAALYISCLQAATPAASQLSKPRPLDASTAAPGEQAAAAEDGGASLRRACTYTVKVKTSCGSAAARWSGAVSLAFGDAYRNEVYVARLTPRYGFERCATDTFRVSGPCGYGVCYLYLRGAGGRDGWAPEWVRVFGPTSSTPSTFYFGGPLPAGVWYGFDRCVRRPGPAAAVDGDDEASFVAAARSV
ncbi:hypothetical protein PR202_gb26281 [Eleusine coracana subsp. coracana]|uniref:Uncharacterized protein n=1 Tax=Eleusine coracana subsp. coracana TaxID=191504 RepID=A0AAV5FRF4_ELECO|nr:hypothetical protein QOZ80_1BG0060100 [Eleusine coracana subsp. coracana]GJN37340.1 hypothetical protein PR202_gb26281 [Eleusine coracana subsp. coracana]